ncbi:zinc transport system substrate-binding protein [Persephonella hydrogeniphila]|uniref:Zinc transport system substrate-binding protein n=1 Tax=Persephonella hydrogeniphila TaxID=198703 RepID=A0A285N386_9AQUI|nr:metal ABC transporter substrate-binding protein [Persephonella hydrogeniphila]SNZ02211.1 zinc transport system substrate-binding protein [Persephonella hydrogeniphila]
MKKLLLLLFLTLINVSFGTPTIYTTVKPIADIVSYITGDKTGYLIPPNASPHIYEFKTSDIRKAYKSDLFIYIGSGEPKLTGILESIPENRKIKIIDIKGLKLLGEEEHEEKHIHPAVWLDPDNAVVIARFIEKKIEKIDPSKKDYYRKNLEKFVKEIRDIKEYGLGKFSHLKNKKFISYHYAWPYFVRAFGLEYAGVIEMGHGREPTPKHLIKIISTIKKYRIPSIFVSVQFYNPRYIKLIKREVSINIVYLDPFGIKNDYIQMMKENIDKIFNGLNQ